ncbi:MAG: fatty acid desaturase [Planctomycetes bacterium]|nr:fatty acid desaturase [Planctomycetota bacterium]
MATTLPEVDASESAEFSVRQARDIVRDLFEPSARIYWTDFLLSIILGWVGFALLRRGPTLGWQAVGYVIAVLLFYRAGSFIHELIHLRTGTYAAFHVVWNLLCGIPLLMPSFMYATHIAHHARNHYGTEGDGEYLPLGTGKMSGVFWYLCQPLVIPWLAILRFLVLTPLCWISPPLRRFVQQRASSLVMDPSYIRPLPSHKELFEWRLQETATWAFTTGAAVLFLTGALPWSLLFKVYLISLGTLLINELRTMGAHRFLYDGKHELTFVEQLVDSVNYPTKPIVTGLWAPVGLRYHALHHLFPSMPYHQLDAAHKRLMAQLPADSVYRQVNSPGLTTTLKDLFRRIRAQQAGQAKAQG